MKKTLLAFAMATIIASPQTYAPKAFAMTDDVKIGILLGFTGPLESLMGPIADGAELAINEVNKSNAFMDGSKVIPVRADSTCVDASAATAAAERLVTADKIDAMVGADCSGVTSAVLQNVALPNGLVMISPSATSPSLSETADNGLFFRTAPSDARQGVVIADILQERGFKSAAISYTNNDYGKGLAENIIRNFKERGGKITISASHEDGKADYAAEAAALDQAGGDVLIVAGYGDQGGKGLLQSVIDSDSFDNIFLPEGMFSDVLFEAIGNDLDGAIGTRPDSDSPSASQFAKILEREGLKPSVFVGEAYDAASLIMLAMQAAGSSTSNDFKGKVTEVANAPGTKIYPGELAKALKLLADGKDIDFVGVTDIELIGPGDTAGSYAEVEFKGNQPTTIQYR